MVESLRHLNLLLQLQAESFQETLDTHISGIYQYSHYVSSLNSLSFLLLIFHVFPTWIAQSLM